MENQKQTNNSEKKFTATKMSLPVVYNKENGLPYVMRMYRDGSYVLLHNGQKPMFNRRRTEDMPAESNLTFLGWVGVEVGYLGLRHWMNDLCNAYQTMTPQVVWDAFNELETAGVVFKHSNKHPMVRFSVSERTIRGNDVCSFVTTEDSDVWMNVTGEDLDNIEVVGMFLHLMIRKGLCKDFRFEIAGGDVKLGESVKQVLDELYGVKERATLLKIE